MTTPPLLRSLAAAFGVFLGVAPRAAAHGDHFTGTVSKVIEGDLLNVHVRADNRRLRKVRLYGVDCPEPGQPHFGEALKRARELADDRAVTVHVRAQDKFRRTIGHVVLPDGSDLGRHLIGEGHCWFFPRIAPRDTELKQLETEARENGRGLWSQENPVAPWEWKADPASEASSAPASPDTAPPQP